MPGASDLIPPQAGHQLLSAAEASAAIHAGTLKCLDVVDLAPRAEDTACTAQHHYATVPVFCCRLESSG